MIKSLRIKNVALIPELVINFEKGLNILSGETGAGKSVIADSLGFVLGEKAEVSLIRQGENAMAVEAVFDAAAVENLLAEQGIESDDILILKRNLSKNGKSDIYINGQQTTLAMLKKISQALIDIYGQSGHSDLLRTQTHLEIVDGFGDGIFATKIEVAEFYHQYKKIEKEIKSYGGDAIERERQIDLLMFQIEEIEKAEIKDGEEEDLLAKRSRIINTEKIFSAIKNAKSALENEHGAVEKLRLAAAALTPVTSIDAEIDTLKTRLAEVRLEVDDINACLSDIAHSINYDQKTADKIENRLHEIRSIRKKYGATPTEIYAYLTKIKHEYDRLTQAEDTISTLNKELEKVKIKLYSASKTLSEMRHSAAENLEKEIKNELDDLGLAGGGVAIKFSEVLPLDKVSFSANGFDKAEIFFSANKGEDLRPLAKIISGGEMSRFMLAVKNVTARIFSLPTMFFDEIDAGISGRIAEKVAVKLGAISRAYQVISITHLPQIAAMGDANFLIEKSVCGEKTITSVKRIENAEKIAEVARLSGGVDVTTTAHKHAEELIAWCEGVKSKNV